MSRPRLHRTPRDAVQEIVTELVQLREVRFKILRPLSRDLFFDHPEVRRAYEEDEFIPYWTELWPSAWLLAQTVLDEPWDEYPQPLEVLEVACGLGLAGLAALHRGLSVTFSDVDELAVEFATENARQNGFTKYATWPMDLRFPPEDRQWPVILGADLLYEPRLRQATIRFLQLMLAPNGVGLIADPDRVTARTFQSEAEAAGLLVDRTTGEVPMVGDEIARGAIYRVRRRSGAAGRR